MNATSTPSHRLPHTLVAVAVALTLLIATTNGAYATLVDRYNESYPMPVQVGQNPCNPTNPYDLIAISGTVHELIQLTQDSNGTFHALSSYDPNGLKGIDLMTGAVYVAVGASNTSSSYTTLPYTTHTLTQVFNSVLVSTGAAPNVLLLTTAHLTFDADGQLVTDVYEVTAEGCLA